MQRIYADYNATTPLAPEASAAMLPFLLGGQFGNPSSVHHFGREARAALDNCRVRMAKLLGAQESEIIFTSGGTEADNTAILGPSTGHIITSTIEHHAVLHPAEHRHATLLPVGRDGIVDPNDLKKAIRPDTALVSIMSANNETGTLQPVKELADICRERGVPFHTDAVQSFGKEPVNVNDWGVDLLSLAAHKFYGPKGVGLLYVRRGTKFQPLVVGGSHENERRAGTENVAGIVGMTIAAERAAANLCAESGRLLELTEKLATGIAARIPGAHRNGHTTRRVANTVNFSFDGCTFDGLLMNLDLAGIAASSGAACAIGSLQPSHVLMAMGLPVELARAAVRFSFGERTSTEDVDVILDVLPQVVSRLRTLSVAGHGGEEPRLV
jgi:cysteine desulfurase